MEVNNYNTGDKTFNRILLFKPQKNMTYIRKLSMSYGYYTPLAVVDNNCMVEYIGVENNFTITQFKELLPRDRKILGDKRCEDLTDDDSMCIYRIIHALKLDNPVRLEYYRGMRYTNPLESNQIKKSMLDTLQKNNNGLVRMNKPDEYNESDSIHFDLSSIELDEGLLNMDLPYFNSMGAEGQTRLI